MRHANEVSNNYIIVIIIFKAQKGKCLVLSKAQNFAGHKKTLKKKPFEPPSVVTISYRPPTINLHWKTISKNFLESL